MSNMYGPYDPERIGPIGDNPHSEDCKHLTDKDWHCDCGYEINRVSMANILLTVEVAGLGSVMLELQQSSIRLRGERNEMEAERDAVIDERDDLKAQLRHAQAFDSTAVYDDRDHGEGKVWDALSDADKEYWRAS